MSEINDKNIILKEIQYLEEISSKDNKNYKIILEIAEKYYKINLFNKSIEKFSQILKAFPDNKNVLFKLAEVYSHTGDIDSALNSYEKLSQLDPKNFQPFST